MAKRSAALVLFTASGAAESAAGKGQKLPKPTCQAPLKVGGAHGGELRIVPTGWKNKEGYADVLVNGTELCPELGARACFAEDCTPGVYNNTQYARSNLLGKTLRFSTDLTGAGCGCNVAFYMTSMGHNPRPSECFDHYCDASNVCGESCAEIDIMEANQHAWHSTLHKATDAEGAASGFGGGGDGWNGPRNWTSQEYGIGGECIDTSKPFQVAVSFPTDAHGEMQAMHVSLSQSGGSCVLQARIDGYLKGKALLSKALMDGMTPIVSYWADDHMTWMDGAGEDGRGSCKQDSVKNCAKTVRLFDFLVEDMGTRDGARLKQEAVDQDDAMAKRHPTSTTTARPGYDWNSWGQDSWAGQGSAADWTSTTTKDWNQAWSQQNNAWDQTSSTTAASTGAQETQEEETIEDGADFLVTGKEHMQVEQPRKRDPIQVSAEMKMQKSEVHSGGLRSALLPARTPGLPLPLCALCVVASLLGLVAGQVARSCRTGRDITRHTNASEPSPLAMRGFGGFPSSEHLLVARGAELPAV
jgi:hypothetical protein